MQETNGQEQQQLADLGIKKSIEIRTQQHTTVRCAICGDENVRGVCHHCHKYLCGRHIQRPYFYQEPSWEFKGIVPGWRTAVHCKEHRHFVFAFRRMIVWPALIAAAIALLVSGFHLSVLLNFAIQLSQDINTFAVWATWLAMSRYQNNNSLIFSTILELMRSFAISGIIVIGTLAIAWLGEWAYRNFGVPSREKQGPTPPFVPIIPVNYRVLAEETMNGSLVANWPASRYFLWPNYGGVEVKAKFEQGDEQRTRRAFVEKWSTSGSLNPGYIALDMPSGTIAEMGSKNENVKESPWNLMIPTQGHFSDPENWTSIVRQSYALTADLLQDTPDKAQQECPLWILPVLKPLSAGRTLVILFKFNSPWSKHVWNLRDLASDEIYPDIFAKNEAAFPVQEVNGSTDRNGMKVYWKNWSVSEKTLKWPTITFTRPVTELRRSLKFRFVLETNALLSGLNIDETRIWLPTGQPAQASAIVEQYKSSIEGQLSIHPDFFAYNLEIVTEPKISVVDVSAFEPRLFSDILKHLSHENSLNIYSVIQSTPLISPQQDVVVNQWDIWGHHYIDFYPIDLHLAITSKRRIKESNTQVRFDIICRVLGNCQVESLSTTTRAVEERAEVLSENVQDELARLLRSS
jgi:hypothetical protein